MPTKISWTDETWPVVTGCTPVSAGCAHCYAATAAAGPRLRKHPRYEGLTEGGKWIGAVRLNKDVLEQPFHWKKPRRVFVASMGDLFHEDVPFDYILKIFATTIVTPWHTYQILTKRPERMRAFYSWWRATSTSEHYLCLQIGKALDTDRFTDQQLKLANDRYLQHCDQSDRGRYDDPVPWPIPNVWLGVTAENQECADERIPELLDCPAAVRFVSVEPMLEPVDLWAIDTGRTWPGKSETSKLNALAGYTFSQRKRFVLNGICEESGEAFVDSTNEESLDWAIIGCESGPKRRPCKMEWVRDLANQCKEAGVPVFIKQLDVDGKLSRHPAEWPEDLRLQEFPC